MGTSDTYSCVKVSNLPVRCCKSGECLLTGFWWQGFVSELLVLVEEFEATKRIMQGEKFVQCARLGTGLQGQLSDCLVALQQMASTLEQKVVPMQQLTAALKQADGRLQEQLSPVQAAQIQGLLLEMRPLCHKFSLKLRELRSLASRVLDLAFWRARNPMRVKTIKIDCSAVAVLVLFFLSVWASRLLPQLV